MKARAFPRIKAKAVPYAMNGIFIEIRDLLTANPKHKKLKRV